MIRNDLLRRLFDSRYKTKEWEIINPKCVELKYSETDDSDIEATCISAITAAFTTANARMNLYDMLSWLHPSQICYCDTDNVMFIYNKNKPLHKAPSNDATDLQKSVKFGKGLSEWESECQPGEFITELVVGRANSYSYKTNTGNTVIKQKGITMDAANYKLITFQTMRDLVLNNTIIQSEERYTFIWDNTTKDVVTQFLSRSIRSSVHSTITTDGFDTLPRGYKKKKANNKQQSKQASKLILIVWFCLYNYNKIIS